MRMFMGLLLLVAIFCVPVLAAGDGYDCPFSKKITRCCKHMCPMAQSATKDGYEVVSQLPVAVLSLSELDV